MPGAAPPGPRARSSTPGSAFVRAGGGGAVAARCAGRARRRGRLLLRARARTRTGGRRWRSSRTAACACTSPGAIRPTRRAVTFLEPGGERTIVTLGDRLEPRGADELEWERLRRRRRRLFHRGRRGRAAAARHASPFVVASPRARSVLETDEARVYALVFSEGDEDERAWAEHVASHARLLVATEGDRGGRWWGESEGRWAAGPAARPAPGRLRVWGLVRGGVHARTGPWRFDRARPRGSAPRPGARADSASGRAVTITRRNLAEADLAPRRAVNRPLPVAPRDPRPVGQRATAVRPSRGAPHRVATSGRSRTPGRHPVPARRARPDT